MKKILTILLAALGLASQAQVAPSPDAMGVANTGNAEDLYRGYVTEMVPIYTVASENGYQVPVQLIYQTRGIKVSDIASSVGLGWNLSAGGAITRVMRDQPDDQSTFTENLTSSIVSADQVSGTKGYDFEKDIFYISFPGGGGKFISTANKMTGTSANRNSFHGLPYNDLKISFFKTSDLNSRFEVLDTQGIKYVFGKNDAAREITTSQSYEQGQIPKANEDWTYISTWFLEEIIFPNLPDTEENRIIFTYQKDQSLTNSNTVSSKSYDLVEDHQVYLAWRTDSGNTITFYDPVSFDNPNINPKPTITFDFSVDAPQSLPFSSPFPRPFSFTSYNIFNDTGCKDIPNCSAAYSAFINYQPWLDFPLWVVGSGGYVKDINLFDQNSVQYYTAQSVGGQKHQISEANISASRLKKIESKKATVTFKWGNRSDITSLKKIDEILVKDHAGVLVHDIDLGYNYFDAGCSDSEDCKRLKLTSVSRNGQSLATFTYMDDASPSVDLPKRSSVKKDVFDFFKNSVSGKFGSVDYKIVPERINDPDPKLNNVPFYDYSANTISLGSQNRTPSSDAKAASLWKVDYPGGAQKTFSYDTKNSGGIVITNISVEDGKGNIAVNKSYTYDVPIGMKSSLHTPLSGTVTLFSDSPYLGYDHLSIGGYRDVTVTDQLTNIVSEYEFYTNQESESSVKSHWSSSWTKIGSLPSNAGPMLPPSFSPFPGLPKNITIKDANGNIIKSEFFNYLYSQSATFTFTEHAISLSDNGEYALAEVDQKCRTFQLDNRKISNYEDDVLISETTVNYSYLSTYKTLPNIVTTYRSDDNGAEEYNSQVETYYPMNESNIDKVYSASVLGEMVEKHMIGVPIQVKSRLKTPDNGAYLASDIRVTTYRKQHGLIQPYETYYQPIETLGIYNTNDLKLIKSLSYNDDGLLASSSTGDGIATRFSYDSQGYMVSKTIDPGPSAMEQTTTYTYKPLVGVETVTNPLNETITYEYDDKNRLKLIRDKDDNIVERYRYNFGNESNLIDASITHSGPYVKNEPVSFNASNVQVYGSREYKWDLNGTEKSGKNVSKSFGSSGNKTIKLSIISPEYSEPFNDEISIYIHDDFWSVDAITGINNDIICQDGTQNGEPWYIGGQFLYADLNQGGHACETSGSWTYDWEYSLNQSSWLNLPNNTESFVEFPQTLGNIDDIIYIRVRVKDWCNDWKISPTRTITVTGASCSSGGGDNGDGNPPTGCTTSISTTPSSHTFGENGGTLSNVGVNNVGSLFTISESMSWITTQKNGTTFNITCQSNGGNPRSGVITITADGCTYQMSVNQDANANNSCPTGCTWDFTDGRCEDSNGSPCAM
ncbi:BACON domain-containing protein [Ekhidna sp. To15]|uniref:BACON domain-containing protein n=1 Tax=Ekhidna sp. To15 TaxID=3395267 RepID=UPI003F51BE57